MKGACRWRRFCSERNVIVLPRPEYASVQGGKLSILSQSGDFNADKLVTTSQSMAQRNGLPLICVFKLGAYPTMLHDHTVPIAI